MALHAYSVGGTFHMPIASEFCDDNRTPLFFICRSLYLVLYATFLQLRTITLPMQESVIKNLILSSLVRVFFQALCFN